MSRYAGPFVAAFLFVALALGGVGCAKAEEEAEATEAQATEAQAAAATSAATATPATEAPAPAALEDRALGNADAPVTIVEYASMTCSHCAAFHTQILPSVKKDLIDTGKARLVFRDFPLDRLALTASMMARCAPADQYFNLVEVIFSNQARWVTSEDPMKSLAQMGRLAGLGQEAFDACIADKALETAILENMQAAQAKWGIRSTPSFIFNDGAAQLSGTYPYEEFAKTVENLSR